MKHRLPSVVRLALPAAPLAVALGLLQVSTAAQDRLKTMPGYQQYQKMLQEIPGAVKLGSLGVKWSPDGKSFEYIQRRQALSLRRGDSQPRLRSALPRRRPDDGGRRSRRARRRPGARARAAVRFGAIARRQAEGVLSRSQPLGQRRQRRQRGRDHDRRQREGADQVRHRELGLRRRARSATAMWWSPDSRKLAYYRFDEKQVPDYYLQLDQTQIQSKDDVEAYPKAGAPNPDRRPVRLRRRVEEERRRSTSATASRSTTPSSATTSTASPGRRTARSCCSTAPTAGRTSSSSRRRTPTTGRDARRSSARSGRPAGSRTARR